MTGGTAGGDIGGVGGGVGGVPGSASGVPGSAGGAGGTARSARDAGEEALERMRALIDRIDQQERVEARRDEERMAELAERARAGELGEDWKRIQGRVDRGDTTLEAVFTGTDDSPEAGSLRATSRARTADLATTIEESEDDELNDALEGLAAARDRLAAMLGSLGATSPGAGGQGSGTGPGGQSFGTDPGPQGFGPDRGDPAPPSSTAPWR